MPGPAQARVGLGLATPLVTWTKDGATLTMDGDTLTRTVTDRRASTYENVLTLPATRRHPRDIQLSSGECTGRLYHSVSWR